MPMSRSAFKFAAVVLPVLLAGACSRSAPPTVQAASIAPAPERLKREIRITGLIQAVHSVKIFVPQIQGQYNTMTLTQLVDNGAHVAEGDLIATFDPAQQMDAARDAKAKFDDLQHQIAQKIAENRAAAASRAVDLKSAQADLEKATLELTKGDTVQDIIKVQNEIKAAAAKIHVDSLIKSNALNDKAEAAAAHVLELQRDRQQIYIQRADDNIKKLQVHAPQAGMVVYELTYRAGSMGHAQVGDQIYRGYPLLSIFDPSEMRVRCSINEPDILTLASRGKVTVHLDAYPDTAIPAHFEYSSPVASSALGTPIKTFLAVFDIDAKDPHLLPDLSAAVVLGGAQ
jgi:multidrug efflux pump subunit AcrA (membrane-fusion protein)